jgi:hypothetical protein
LHSLEKSTGDSTTIPMIAAVANIIAVWPARVLSGGVENRNFHPLPSVKNRYKKTLDHYLERTYAVSGNQDYAVRRPQEIQLRFFRGILLDQIVELGAAVKAVEIRIR